MRRLTDTDGLSDVQRDILRMAAYLIATHGTDEQREYFLPRMAAGEVRGALSMSGPCGRGGARLRCRPPRLRTGGELCEKPADVRENYRRAPGDQLQAGGDGRIVSSY
jgi:Acyl-CoA dehydrogenase, N-terminal domain